MSVAKPGRGNSVVRIRDAGPARLPGAFPARLACPAQKAVAVGRLKRGAEQRPTTPLTVRSEGRISHNSAQRRPSVVPDDMRALRGTTMPRYHRPADQAVGRPVEPHRPADEGREQRTFATKTDNDTERQLVHTLAHAIVFIVSICYL